MGHGYLKTSPYWEAYVSCWQEHPFYTLHWCEFSVTAVHTYKMHTYRRHICHECEQCSKCVCRSFKCYPVQQTYWYLQLVHDPKKMTDLVLQFMYDFRSKVLDVTKEVHFLDTVRTLQHMQRSWPHLNKPFVSKQIPERLPLLENRLGQRFWPMLGALRDTHLRSKTGFMLKSAECLHTILHISEYCELNTVEKVRGVYSFPRLDNWEPHARLFKREDRFLILAI